MVCIANRLKLAQQHIESAVMFYKMALRLVHDTSKQPIITRYLGHVTGYQPIRDQYFLIRSVPGTGDGNRRCTLRQCTRCSF